MFGRSKADKQIAVLLGILILGYVLQVGAKDPLAAVMLAIMFFGGYFAIKKVIRSFMAIRKYVAGLIALVVVAAFLISFATGHGITIEMIGIGIGLTLVTIATSLYGIRYYKRSRLLQSDIHTIDKMTGEEFEMYLEALFDKQGYSVERTPLSGDYGADLIINKGGAKIAVQAKRYTGKIGVDAVQEVVGALNYYKANRGMVITNSYYTPQAQKLADANRIELWDRDRIVKEVLATKRQSGE